MTRFHGMINKKGENVSIPYTPEEEIEADAMVANALAEEADYIANHKYKDDRKKAYGSVEDQLDMIYWDQVNGTTAFKDHVTAIKAAHPKPI